jgi:hypothetical protein
MEYPVISLSTIQEFLQEVRSEGRYIDSPTSALRGVGESFDLKYRRGLSDLEQNLSQVQKSNSKRTDIDEIEGKLSTKVFDLFNKLPAEILTDRDFWRYLSCTYFFDFIIWRDGGKEGAIPSDASFGASSKTITMDCVPFRMFNRGLIDSQLSGGKTTGAFAQVPGTDIWRSHILRVRTSYSPELVRQILEKVVEGKLSTDVIRPLAKEIRRLRANIIFENLDQVQTKELFESEYLKVSKPEVKTAAKKAKK